MWTTAVAAMLAVALSLSAGGVDATVDGTCKAAAASDKRVNLRLCLSQLGHHRDSPDADTWDLAKVASLVGVDNADLAAADIKTLQGKPAPALAQCATLYRGVAFAFAGAYDEINKRAYAAGKQRLAEAISLTQQCNAAFAKSAGIPLPPPLAQRNADSIQIAIIATAITNLLK